MKNLFIKRVFRRKIRGVFWRIFSIFLDGGMSQILSGNPENSFSRYENNVKF